MRFAIGIVLLLVACYAAATLALGWEPDIAKLFFSTPDSQQYRDTAVAFFGTGQGGFPERALVYPLILDTLGAPETVVKPWLGQVACWLLAGSLVFMTAWRAGAGRIGGVLAALPIALNLSMIILTFFGLSETIVLLLFSVLTLMVVSLDQPLTNPKSVCALTLMFATLVCTKTTFHLQLALYALTVLVVAAVTRRGRGRLPGLALAIALGLAPIVAQTVAIARRPHAALYPRSNEAGLAFLYYFMPALLVTTGEAARFGDGQQLIRSRGMDVPAAVRYVIDHPADAARTYWNDMADENIFANSNFTQMLGPRPKVAAVTGLESRVFGWLLLGSLVFGVLALPAAYPADRLRLLLLLGVLLAYIGPLGFVLAQGDRYIAPTMPLWIALWVISSTAIVRRIFVRQPSRPGAPATAV